LRLFIESPFKTKTMKNVIVHFDFPNGTTQEQYDRVWDDIRAAGQEHPKGLIFHAAAPKPDGGWFVADVWESEQAFANFGNFLMPLIQKSGIPMVPPTIMEAHYVYQGQHETVLS
jgi:hypothetical protein